MKTSVIIFVCLLFLGCLEKKPQKPFNGDWVIDSTRVFYKNQELKFGAHINTWIKVLGKPTRVHKLPGHYIWDSSGFYVYCKQPVPGHGDLMSSDKCI